jgi:nitrate/nitrite-specific signal transduction histidine kinase
MGKLPDFLLQLLSQFAGGPGLLENNLVRFLLPAILWGALLVVAWSRQREQDLPREKLLVWGFALGVASALLMAAFVSLQMMEVIDREVTYPYLVPVDRALAMASIVVVAGAFLRYTLDDARIARLYLQAGLGITAACLLVAFWFWPRSLATLTEADFHQTWAAWLFAVPSSLLILTAIVLLRRKVSWLSNVVTIALLFFLSRELLTMVNYATDKSFNHLICPIGNSLRILAIPLLGYVYLREQSIDKKHAEAALKASRQHLEELVTERTAELTAVNSQLTYEVAERKRAEAEIAQRNATLAAQNTVATSLSRSLELETILDKALGEVLSVAGMDVGLVFLQETDRSDLALRSCRGDIMLDEIDESRRDWCCCQAISREAIDDMHAVVHPTTGYLCNEPDSNIHQQGLQLLVSVPLVAKNRAVGALTLASRRTDLVPPQAIELLTTIGHQIGMAIENAHLYQRAERTARELNLLHQMSVVLTSTLNSPRIYHQIAEQSVKLLDCHMACILSWNEEAQHAGLVASYGLGAAEHAALQSVLESPGRQRDFVSLQQSIVLGDIQNDPASPHAWVAQLGARALLGVPIQGMGDSLGTLFVMNRLRPRIWEANELELIESFVNRAAVALMNANLCRQLEWTAALEERQRIAADMHDGLAQTVSLLGLQLEEVAELVANDRGKEAVAELSGMRDIVEQASVDVRRSIASLQRTPQPRRPLQELLAELPAQLVTSSGPEIELVYEVQEPLFLPLEQRGQVLLIVQEMLVNALRHARAQRIRLILACSEHEAQILVEDDGIGFDPTAWWENSEDHFGLGVIHARAARIGARLQIDSSPGRGTCVTLTIPLAAYPCRIQPGQDGQDRTHQNLVALGRTS